MRHDESGKGEINEQAFTVNRAEYKVLTKLIETHATKLATLSKKNVDDWTDESTTPEKRDALCFKVNKVK